jgi:protein-disulfide isomerase
MELIMKKGTVLALLLVVLGGGYGLGRLATRDKDSNSPNAGAAMPTAQGPSDGIPRVRVALEGPMKGPADAKVTIVEFSDFQCPYCKRAADVVSEVSTKYGDDVRVVFRNFPLPYHKSANLAAQASLAAHEQGKFWEMHDQLFAHQQTLDRAAIDGFARELGLDTAKFAAALDSGKYAAAVNADLLAGGPLVDGTPTLFVNGHKLTNPALLAQAVGEELKKRRR